MNLNHIANKIKILQTTLFTPDDLSEFYKILNEKFGVAFIGVLADNVRNGKIPVTKKLLLFLNNTYSRRIDKH